MDITIDNRQIDLQSAKGKREAIEALFKWVGAISDQVDANSDGLEFLLDVLSDDIDDSDNTAPKVLLKDESAPTVFGQAAPANWSVAPDCVNWYASNPEGDSYWFISEPFIRAVAYEDDDDDLDAELRWRVLGSERGIYAGENPAVNKYNFHRTLERRPR